MGKISVIEKTHVHLHNSQSNERGETYKAFVYGKDFYVLPNVFSPKYFRDAEFFSHSIPVLKNGSFLEIGCGTGVTAIFAAMHGATRVVATDINPDAITNTRKNVRLHKLQDKIMVREGDLFEPVQGELFDQIFWNVPFVYTETKGLSILERSTFDYRDSIKKRFIKEAKEHLTPNGKLLIGYSSNYGNLKNIFQILEEHNYSAKIIAQTQQDFSDGSINLELIEAIPNELK